jgi:RimJ/RimL family protein N-acetyltransferase
VPSSQPHDNHSGQAVLRDWSPADGSWYIAQLGDPDIQRFTSERADTTVDDFTAALGELRQCDDLAGFAIIDSATGELAGNLAAARSDDTAVIHYWIAPSSRGRGVATEAVRQMCRWIAANWSCGELRLDIYADNEASQRVAEKAGFHHQPDRDHLEEHTQRAWRVYIRSGRDN